jgi:hypothetical protein
MYLIRLLTRSQIPGWADGSSSAITNTALSRSPGLVSQSLDTLPNAGKGKQRRNRKNTNNTEPVPTAPSNNTQSQPSASTDPKETSGEKPLSKADKKALKKATRASKVAARGGPSQPGKVAASPSKSEIRSQSDKRPASQGVTGSKESISSKKALAMKKEVALFSHLQTCDRQTKTPDVIRKELQSKGQPIHPSIVRLGVQYQHYVIIGSNQRCIAMLQAFREVCTSILVKTSILVFVSENLRKQTLLLCKK